MNVASAQTAETRTENLAGLVERVTFHNEENGFCVLRLKARGQRDLITLIGHAAMISAGEWVQAAGTWTNDRTHGLQFRASFIKATPPTTLDGIERYLGSGMIRGIGAAYARRLVAAFGETVFDVIEDEPGRLREVEGIGPVRALGLDQRSLAFPDGASAASVTAAVGAIVDLGRDDADEVASSARAHIIR